MKQCWEVRPKGRCLGRNGSTLMNGLMLIIKGLEASSSVSYSLMCSLSPPHDAFCHFMMQQVVLHHSVFPWSWTSQPPESWDKQTYIVYKSPNLWHSVTAAQKWTKHPSYSFQTPTDKNTATLLHCSFSREEWEANPLPCAPAPQKQTVALWFPCLLVLAGLSRELLFHPLPKRSRCCSDSLTRIMSAGSSSKLSLYPYLAAMRIDEELRSLANHHYVLPSPGGIRAIWVSPWLAISENEWGSVKWGSLVLSFYLPPWQFSMCPWSDPVLPFWLVDVLKNNCGMCCECNILR